MLIASIETTTEQGTKVIITPAEATPAPVAVVPSNQQIDSAIQEVKQTLEEEKAHLSNQGKKLVDDAESLLSSTSTLLHEKNKDEKLQKLYMLGKGLVDLGAMETVKDTASGVVSKAAQVGSQLGGQISSQAEDLYSYLRETTFNLLTSGEFRGILSDISLLLKSLTLEKIKQPKKEEEGAKRPLTEDELIEDIRKGATELIQKMGGKKEYKQMMKNFFKYSEETVKYLQGVSQSPPEELKKLEKLYDDVMDVASDFVGSKELKEFRSNFWDLFSKLKEDKKIAPWYSDTKNFLLEVIEKPENLVSENTINRMTDLIKKGRTALQTKKWREAINSLNETFSGMMEKLQADTTTKNFLESFAKLGKDMALNEKGYPDLFVLEESISQVKNILVPIFKKQLANLPVKRIEMYSDTYDVILEDLLVSGTGFLPEKIEIHIANDSVLNFESETEDKMCQELQLKVEHIKPEFKNMKFYYKRKSFPTLEDYGKADLLFTGDGMSVKVLWNIEIVTGRHPVATLSQVECVIDSLSIRIVGEETKHEILDTLLAPLMASLLKSKIASMIQDYLTSQLNAVNQQLNDFFASRPIESVVQKGNVALQEAFQKFQENVSPIKSV